MARIIHSTQSLGRMLGDARRSHSLTQTELAERSGLTQATVSKIERGVSRASIETLFRLLAVLHLDLAIVDRDPTPPRNPWDRT